jgi:hypothetical protein
MWSSKWSIERTMNVRFCYSQNVIEQFITIYGAMIRFRFVQNGYMHMLQFKRGNRSISGVFDLFSVTAQTKKMHHCNAVLLHLLLRSHFDKTASLAFSEC